MPDSIDDLCPRPEHLPPQPTRPHAAGLFLSSVYECHDPQQAEALLAGELEGFVYARDGHPNAFLLAEKCRALHSAPRAAIAASGMGALAAAVISQLAQGDALLASHQLYGRSLSLLTTELQRLGLSGSTVDTGDLAAVATAWTPRTRLLVVETISNPTLRVADLQAQADLVHRCGGLLLVDNTFAGPALCRPLDWGADLVLESLTKTMNGHSDVVLGLLCGRAELWDRVPTVLSTWGLASAPFDCWLAARGLATLALRIERAAANALALAEALAARLGAAATVYPGLPGHPQHALARRQFGGRFGTIVTCTLPGGRPAVERFLAGSGIPFCPSLGELSTTLSHPESTSHRGLPPAERAALGIDAGTLRFSLGIESSAAILAAVARGLDAGGL
jgi:cystathionine beta-lyase/cystathionine gamma-synthase